MKSPTVFGSFGHAFRGLVFVFKQERNFRLECVCALVVLGSFFLFRFSRLEMIVLIVLCAAVLILEIVNTVVEHFLDLMKPRLSYQVKVIKDILAGMVLLSVFVSIIVGLIIYIPAVIEMSSQFVIQY